MAKNIKIIFYFKFQVVLSLFIIILSNGNGEIYKGIMPSDNFGVIKSKFPGAKFDKKIPAWAQENDVLYEIEGEGISGKIIILFNNNREFFKKSSEQIDSTLLADSIQNLDTTIWDENFKKTRKNMEELSESYRQIFNEYSDDGMSVVWVRWIPDNKIPLKRFILKYGKPDTTDFTGDDLSPYKFWKRGITVFYDEKEYVERVDYNFTYEDEKSEYLQRNHVNEIPIYFDNLIRLKYNLPIRKRGKARY